MTETENLLEEEVVEENEATEEIDWKSRALEAEQKAEKAEKNFKKLARELNTLKARKKDGDSTEDLDDLVSKKVAEINFYSTNPLAKDHQEEIQEIQSKYPGMSAEDALNLHLSKTNPEILAKAKVNSVGGVDGVDKTITGATDPKTPEDIKNMSKEEFEEYRKNRGK